MPAVLALLSSMIPRVEPGLGPLPHLQIQNLRFQNRHRAGPAGRGLLDLHRKARDHEAGSGELLEVRELLHMAVTDLAAGFVALPDQAGVAGFLETLRREAE